MVDPDRQRKRRGTRAHTLFDIHINSDVHLRGHPSHSDTRIVSSEQVREESKEFYGFIFGMTSNFPDAAKFHQSVALYCC